MTARPVLVDPAWASTLAGALESAVPYGPDDDAVRAVVWAWVRAHAGDEGLTHEVVARAQHTPRRRGPPCLRPSALR